VWTGTELIGWEASNRGVAYNPARDSWRVLPRSPLATHNGRGRLGAVMVWTGTQMVIWGGWTGAFKDAPFPDGAAFQPATL
jgi:hypothetical protein